MRFAPEREDGANAGLGIERDILQPVKRAVPEASTADIWTLAGAQAVELLGGPKINHAMGRTDATSGKACPPTGRLPDASQGADHLRDVFYRMGFDDREIVALSGAHTLGRCHKVRSGFDGPWTSNPLKFDAEYFRNPRCLNQIVAARLRHRRGACSTHWLIGTHRQPDGQGLGAARLGRAAAVHR